MAVFDPTNPDRPVHPEKRRDFNPVAMIVAILVVAILLEIVVIAFRGAKPLRAYLAVERGNAALSRRDFKEAEKQFKEAVQLNPNSEEAHVRLLEVYRVTGKQREMLNEYKALARIRPDLVELRVQYAFLLDRNRQYADAERELRAALKLDPNHAAANNNLSYLYAEQNRNLKEALAMAQKAVRIEPNAGFIWDTLGWVHYRMKNYKDAENALQKVLEVGKDNATLEAAHYHLGMVYVRMNRIKDAKAHFSEVPQLSEFYQLSQKSLQELQGGREVPDEIIPRGNVTTARRFTDDEVDDDVRSIRIATAD